MPFVAGFAAALLVGAALLDAAELVAADVATRVVLFWLVALAEEAGADAVALTDAAALVAAAALDDGAAELAVVLTGAAPPQAASKPAAAPPLKSTRQARRESWVGFIGCLRLLGSRRMAIHVGGLAASINEEGWPVKSTATWTCATAFCTVSLPGGASDGAAVARDGWPWRGDGRLAPSPRRWTWRPPALAMGMRGWCWRGNATW
jgi:hypothetical protein